MVGIACSLVGGMALASTGLLPVGLFFFAAVFLLILCSLFPGMRKSASSIFLLVAMVAACRYMVAGAVVSNASVNGLQAELPEGTVQLAGRVCGFPEYHPYETGFRGTWSFPVRVEGLCLSNVWKRYRGAIDVRMAGQTSAELVQYGCRVRLTGRLHERTFPGGNPVQLEVQQKGGIQILAPAKRFSPVSLGRAWRESAARRLEQGIARMPVQQAVLKALVLGYRKEVPSETLDRFRRTGSVHIFAISGLHVGIMGLLLALVLKSVGIPRDWFGIWLMPLLLAYVVSTGMKPSALRALAMAGVFVLAPLFRCRPDIPSSVAFAAILLLLFQPLELMSAGFVLSFTVVVFIVMVFSKVPKALVQGGWLKSYAVSLVVTSAAASLASLPLAALYFGTFSPIALLGNLLVVPITFFIVLSGWLSILLPIASATFNHAAVVFINGLLWCVGALDRLPGSSWQVEPPPLLAVAVWYGSLIYLFAHATQMRQRWLGLAGIASAMLLAMLA
jgi:competence protein ComEC